MEMGISRGGNLLTFLLIDISLKVIQQLHLDVESTALF